LREKGNWTEGKKTPWKNDSADASVVIRKTLTGEKKKRMRKKTKCLRDIEEHVNVIWNRGVVVVEEEEGT